MYEEGWNNAEECLDAICDTLASGQGDMLTLNEWKKNSITKKVFYLTGKQKKELRKLVELQPPYVEGEGGLMEEERRFILSLLPAKYSYLFKVYQLAMFTWSYISVGILAALSMIELKNAGRTDLFALIWSMFFSLPILWLITEKLIQLSKKEK